MSANIALDLLYIDEFMDKWNEFRAHPMYDIGCAKRSHVKKFMHNYFKVNITVDKKDSFKIYVTMADVIVLKLKGWNIKV